MTLKHPREFFLAALAGSLWLASSFPSTATAQNLDELFDAPQQEEKPGSVMGELVKEVGGGTLFRLAPLDNPDQSLTNRVFWRRFLNHAAAQTAPVMVKVDDKPVIGPKTVQDETTQELSTCHPLEGRSLLAAGTHTLQPGGIPLSVGERISSDHPAIRVAGDEVRILCAPIRLDAVDATGAPVPRKIAVSCGTMALLREEALFSPLVIWLPIGLRYRSSLGGFEVTADGKITANPADLEAGVSLTPEGLRLTTIGAPVSAPLTSLDPKRLYLASHRARSVFAQTEIATFTVIAPRGHVGGEARIMGTPAEKAAVPIELGKVTLPAVKSADFDSRLFTMDMAALPPGRWELSVTSAAGQTQPLSITIVPWYQRSPFFVHSFNATADTTTTPQTTDDQLALMRNAGYDMAYVSFDARMPAIDPLKLTALRRENPLAPPEAALVPSPNDLCLQSLLQNEMRSLDLVVTRSAALYNEGLSYHHSYQPSVDRMIRRLQVFSQQTADYPSFYAINYSWFPALFGYAEAAIPTDAHVHDRNVTLNANLARAGYTNITAEQRKWYMENRSSPDPATREKALGIARQIIRYWKAQMDFGFGRHNKLYNDAVRQARPQTLCTLFENAGHDAMKRTRSLYNDMDAICYESYTDYGEWAMSTGYTADWARGNFPGRPVWISIDWGTSPEGMMKSLFHGFARGLNGGGTPLGGRAAETLRRGKGMQFVAQYGAISSRAMPDNRLAILVTDAEQAFDFRAPFVYHALYYHLTRLGYPPVLVDEETVTASGIPESVKALFIVRQTHPLEAGIEAAIETFQKRGGKVVATGDSLVKPSGALVVDAKIVHIFMLSGFAWKTHSEMWNEFETHWRKPLTKTLDELGIPAFARTDTDRGTVLGLDAGPVRYVVALADKQGTHYADFEATEALPVSLEGTGWIVRDLAKQKTLPSTAEDGRTKVTIDLVTEPTTLLALYKAAPDKLNIKVTPSPALGSEITAACNVLAAERDLGPVPIAMSLLDVAGRERETLYRAAGDEVTFALPSHDKAGQWTLRVQELLTGLTAQMPIQVSGAPSTLPPPARPVGDVHVVNESQIRTFGNHPGEKRVIVEPNQRDLLPLAQRLVDGLNAAGITARLWQVRPEEFDTLPMRYYPRPEDKARLSLIEAGNLIGYRENMEPYIDSRKRVHVPERGGMEEIQPLFMVGKDCVIFSGGMLADSLRAVTPWMDTPSVPGLGQGRLVMVYSPFMANRHVVAVIGHDADGMAKAADQLVALLSAKENTLPSALPMEGERPREPGSRTGSTAALVPLVPEVKVLPVNQPYVNYTPLRRIQRIFATPAGKAIAILNGKKDNTVFVDEQGQITATVALDHRAANSACADDQGRLWNYTYTPSTSGGKLFEVSASRISPDGVQDRTQVMFSDGPNRMGPHQAERAFPIAPDGTTAALGRLGGLFVGDLAKNSWNWIDDMAFVRKTFEVWTPRFPTAMAFSPDSRYLFVTMDTRPTGYENMHQRLNRNEGGASLLVDTTTGKVLWHLRKDSADYSCGDGFAAVARDGAVTALFDVWSRVAMVDRTGRIMAEEVLRPRQHRNDFEVAPIDGVGAWISPGGTLAAFATRDLLVLGDGKTFTKVKAADLVSCVVIDDGPLAVIGLLGGEVKAFDAVGKESWGFQPGGVAPQLAASGNRIFVGTSEGTLITLDNAGREIRRGSLAPVADRERHEPSKVPGIQIAEPPRHYAEPETLRIATERLGAKKVAEWKPAGQGNAAFGRTFYPLAAGTELMNPADSEAFVHLVYRRAAENKKLAIGVVGKAGRTDFALDLPTPLYRAVDIPLKGANTKAVLTLEGPIEVAEFSLWAFAWPEPNVAFVKPPDTAGDAGTDLAGNVKEDLDLSLDVDGGGSSGSMKETRIWSPNPDIDKIQGPWVASPNGLLAVNGSRWDLGSWSGKKFVGEWLTQKMGKPVQVSMAATYDSSTRQSQVTKRLAVFQNALSGERAQGGDVLGAVIDNDQFWRLFRFDAVKATILGTYVYSEDGAAEGLSELEFYR